MRLEKAEDIVVMQPTTASGHKFLIWESQNTSKQVIIKLDFDVALRLNWNKAVIAGSTSNVQASTDNLKTTS